ncbi:MAG: beta-galactosidase [Armatimonadetes bacterium]|nr:beta-galactosidase [Armatimonadota bacterium]
MPNSRRAGALTLTLSRWERALGAAIAVLVLLLPALALADEPQPANGSFESPAGWDLALESGATGTAVRDTALARTGAASLRLDKTNGLGRLRLVSSAPVKAQPGVKYVFRGWFHSDDALLNTLLLFRLGPREGNLFYDSIDASAGYSSQSLVVNSARGQWIKRVVSFRTTEPRDVWLNVMVWGNPCRIWLDDIEFGPEAHGQYKPLTPFATPFDEAAARQIVQARPDATAAVDDAGRLRLDGKPATPVIYKGEVYRLESDLARFGEAGVAMATVAIPLGGVNGGPGAWQGAGTYDFAFAEQRLASALHRNPRAYVILDLLVYPYAAWGDEHPDDCWRNAEGQRAYGLWGNVEGYADDLTKVPHPERKPWWCPSYGSEVWQRDARAAVTAVVGHLRTTPWWHAVAGCFLTGGHDGQFQVLIDVDDHSPACLSGFREWLRERYATPEKLAAAWGRPVAPFEAVGLPDKGQGVAQEYYPAHVPVGPLSDYRLYREVSTWRLRDRLAQAAKEAAGKPILTLCYNSPRDKHDGLFTASPHMDATGTMSYYPYRPAGYAAGLRLRDGLAARRKLGFQELDLRSWTEPQGDEVYQMWIGAGETPETWRAIHRKLVAASLAHGQGWWYYDMNHYFDAPETMQEIATVTRFAEEVSRPGRIRFRPDVAVVTTDDGPLFQGPYFSSVSGGRDFQNMQLETSGVPYDTLMLDDVLTRPELQGYRLYVFTEMPHLTAAQRSALARLLKNRERTLVWLYDPGYVADSGLSSEALSELVGMTVRTDPAFTRGNCMVEGDHPFARGVPPCQSAGEMLLSMMALDGLNSFTARYQRFWVDDPAATPLAHWHEDGRVAMAVRKLPGFTSVYLAAPMALDARMLNNVARSAGAFVAGEPGPAIHLNERFASLHATRNQGYQLRLPKGVTRATDVDAGPLAVDGGTVALGLAAGTTRWLRLDAGAE